MSILTGPVNATATTFSVSDDSLLLPNGLPQMLQIESEKFLIRGFEAVGSHNTRWYVDRGVDGSTAASHSGATAITVVSAGGGGGVSVEVPPAAPVAVTNIVAPGASVAGGVASLATLSIAEVVLNFNTAGWIDAFLDIIPIRIGQYILDCGYVVVTPFAGSTDPSADYVALYATGDNSNHLTPTDAVDQPPQTFGAIRNQRADMLVNWGENPKYVVSDGFIRARYSTSDTGPAPTSGSLKAWAIIATPAS